MIEKLATDALNYIRTLDQRTVLIVLAVAGVAIGVSVKLAKRIRIAPVGDSIKLVKRIGVVPVILVPLVLAGAWLAGAYSTAAVVRTVEKPVYVEKIVEKPMSTGAAVAELWDRLCAEQREKERIAAALTEAEKRIAGLLAAEPWRLKGTTVRRNSYPFKEPSNGYCSHCGAELIIEGEKGDDTIRCPGCGATMTALQAIELFTRIENTTTWETMPRKYRRYKWIR